MIRRILKHKSFLESRNSNKINEVFTNDIPWGDSLIGRLINSVSRKARIGFNKNRISGLTKRLESKFDEMIETGNIEVSKENKDFILISTLLGELTKAVKEGEDVDILISMTDNLLNEIGKYDYVGKDVMIAALDDFSEYLRGLDDEKTEDKDDMREKFLSQSKKFLQSVIDISSVVSSGKIKITSSTGERVDFDLDRLIELLSIIEKESKILVTFKSKPIDEKNKILTEAIKIVNEALTFYKSKKNNSELQKYQKIRSRLIRYLSDLIEEGGEYLFINKDGGKTKVKVISKTHSMKRDSSGNSTKDAQLKPGYVFMRSDVDGKISNFSAPVMNLVSINEGFIFESNNISPSSARNAWSRVIKSHSISKISDYIDEIKKILESDNSDDIIKICKQVVLNFKGGVNKAITYDELIKEGLVDNDIPKSISLFGRYILPFRDGLGLLEYLKPSENFIKEFIKSFDELNKFLTPEDNKEEKSNDGESKKESLRYSNFVLLLEKNKFSDQISKKFDELFTSDVVGYFQVSEKKRAELESSAKKIDKFVFTDSDIIIEIVQLFNRSWRIHTPGVIPSGRTGGKVSVSVFNEYEYIGSGSGGSPDNPGGGPYRNKTLWDQWNEAVNKILANTKYRPIFSEKAEFLFTSEGKESGDPIKKGGKILLRFIQRLLADTQMYTSTGAMTKFIEEYFGLKVSDRESYHLPGSESDGKRNSESSSKISKTEVSFSKGGLNFQSLKENKNVLFRIESTSEEFGNRGIGYLRVLKAESDYIIGMFTNGFDFERTNITMDKDYPRSVPGSSSFVCKIKANDFFNSKFDASYIVLNIDKGPGGVSSIKSQISKLYHLVDSKNGEIFTKIKYNGLFIKTDLKKYTSKL